ncbi:cation-transporting ATPase [Penicillium argentinense]|uniref:Cation-transporting ATPase n=1 Tax=Penicillium argentinense TaxID=1131581 RepID=A0A9W9F7Z4_9EURO|nr:cation-transporting ATPase [Penicillium argentinense]KAJ5095152.1 cation-transporting ATPase [Penicillium argentinense]
MGSRSQSPSGKSPMDLSMPRPSLRRDSLRSSVSVATGVSDVEMARDEVFDGPISESIPSSVVSFMHRRNRADSNVSFTYFQDEEDFAEYSNEDAVDVSSDIEESYMNGIEEPDLESHRGSFISKRLSRDSAEHPLLSRILSASSYGRDRRSGSRLNQKIYISSEDLTTVFAGFSTSTTGFVLYLAICILTGGIGYLLLRWLPRWRVRLIGKATPLGKCHWIAIEVRNYGSITRTPEAGLTHTEQDQWNQFTIHDVESQSYGRPLSTVFMDNSGHVYDEDLDPTIVSLRYLDYRYLRFFYHPIEDKFSLINGWKDHSWTNAKAMRGGLDADERDSREQIFGKNNINIEQKSIPQLLMDEAFHPFYMFQVASLLLWSMDEYYYYAVCIFLISVFSIATTVLETRSTMKRLREISLFECDVRVLRNGFWRSVSSQDLAPGDVFEFSDPSLSLVPCDCILLSGDCIVNESMLTGESVPVSKIPFTDEALDYLDLSAPSVDPHVAKHFLFSGTKIIRARRPQNAHDDEAVALAVVARTGFSTTKGALVRSMLFPKPSGFKFYRDSFRYIAVMGIVAFLGFIASFINFVRLGLAWHLIIVRALDLITIVVPPALPATLTIGTNFALSRLKKQSIFCISPQKVNVGGKLDVVCFDKTGTLTEDGLDVLGGRTVSGDHRFSELLSETSAGLFIPSPTAKSPLDLEKQRKMIYTMATCHSLRVVDDELLGDPLDVKMFQFTGWSYEEGGNNSSEPAGSQFETISPSVARPPATHVGESQHHGPNIPVELGVLRNFEFVSHLRRASVVVRQFGDNGASFFVKGAPESIRDICVPESLPSDYDEFLSYYTHKGYRVIACATKYERKLSWMKVQKLTRSDAESNLEFVGFIVFENKLKPTTSQVISELNQAGIRNVMCTGDNILTAISVARECKMIRHYEECFIPHFVEEPGLVTKTSLIWESVDNPDIRLDPRTLLPMENTTETDVSVPGNGLQNRNYCVAVTGDAFRWMVDYGNEDVLKRILVTGKVFARMSPDEKHELVEKLQSIDYCCGFCGDGANDCGALKAADVGISLSDAEASVAAPFTSRQFDISCVPKLIREGRAALVTSFCCFKFMSLYSAIQFSTVSFLYTSGSNLGDFQFLFIDLALIMPIAVFMGWTGPYPTLSRKRPTADLVSRKVLTPLLGQISLVVLSQLVIFETVQKQPWYLPPHLDLEKSNIVNSQNTSLFLFSCFQYILTSIVLSVGPPFRRPMTQNGKDYPSSTSEINSTKILRSTAPYLCTIIIDILVACYMLFRPSKWVADIMQLTFMSDGFRSWVVVLALGMFSVAWMAESIIFPRLAHILGHVRARLQPTFRKKRRQYKVLMEEMRL